MTDSDVFIISPYKAGNKTHSSLAITLPMRLVRQLGLSTSSVFVLSAENPEKLTIKIMEAS